MTKEDFTQEVKVGKLDEQVELVSNKLTIEMSAFARGWNYCQQEILKNIDRVLSRKELEKMFRSKTGSWVYISTALDYEVCRCSVCGTLHLFTKDCLTKYNYCFSCGAKMKSEVN